MRYKNIFKMNIIGIFILFIVLYSYCFFITKNLKSEISISSISDLTTSYAGYNALMIHGTIYCSFFLGIIVINLSSNNAQILTRINRITFIKKNIYRIILVSVCFVFCFAAVFVLNILKTYDYTFLKEINFFLGLGVYVVLLISLYMILGAIYLFFEVIFNEKMYSFFITLICSTSLVCLTLIVKIWTPFENMDVFDQLFVSGLDITKTTIKFVQNVTVYIAITYITIQIFKAKDIIK